MEMEVRPYVSFCYKSLGSKQAPVTREKMYYYIKILFETCMTMMTDAFQGSIAINVFW
jgi:hypothetical protein